MSRNPLELYTAHLHSPLPSPFLDKIEIKGEDDCWEWKAYRTPEGYGQIRVNWKLWLSHRYMWTLLWGDIPEGLVIMHQCDNPCCVNPKHLLLGTHLNNVQDKEAKGRGNAGAANGMAKLSDADVEVIRELYHIDNLSQAEIGRRYGVNRSCICKIVNNTHRTNIL